MTRISKPMRTSLCSSLNAVCSVFTFLLLLAASAFAQQENPLEPGAHPAQSPTVSFELRWPASELQSYSVQIEASGRGAYQSQSRASQNDQGGDPYAVTFVASEPTRNRIFELAKALNFFQGQFETHYKVAQTGSKTLTYTNGEQNYHTTLNYSDRPEMNELVDIFGKISTTFEFGRRLEYAMRFDKLGVEGELKHMEQAQKAGLLEEVQALSPTLERIIRDPSTMNMTRMRAQRLLRK